MLQSVQSKIEDKIRSNIKKLKDNGADFVDARYYLNDDSELLVIYDGNIENNSTESTKGIGVRALFNGAWGFAASSNLNEIDNCFNLAMKNAQSASKLVKTPLAMGTLNAIKAEYSTPVQKDPFDVDLKEKLQFLIDIDSNLKSDIVLHRYCFGNFQRKNVLYFNSDGSEIKKSISNSFGQMMIMGMDKDSKIQRRSMNLFNNGKASRGWEMFTNPDYFAGHTDRIKTELSHILEAETLKTENQSVILLPGQGWLQVHETIGHALELDRILGYELSYAGGSFVNLDSFGTLKYGTEKLNASAFGGIENAAGSFGYDDNGSPERDYLLIENGILKDALTSRAMINEANQKAGREIFKNDGGIARASSFYRAPIDRMSNVNILPGNDGNLDDIIANTENGIIVDNPKSWSIGSNREHFHFGCEIAWEVKDGKRTRVLKDPTYQGHTIEFYNSLTAVGNETTWQMEETTNCGKGEPNQAMQIGHGIPVMKFDNVITGE